MTTIDLRGARLLDWRYSAEQQLASRLSGSLLDSYVASLRLDVLLFETVVLPDVFLLDGWFFSSLTPTDLENAIGRSLRDPMLPLEIRCRRNSLEDSLATFLLRKGREELNDYPLQLVGSTDARLAIAAGLRGSTRSDLEAALARAPTVPRGIGSFLSALLAKEGVVDHEIEHFVSSWEMWLELERNGRLRVIPWDRPLDVASAAQFDRLLPEEELFSAEGRSVYRVLSRSLEIGEANKSDLMRLLVELEPEILRDPGSEFGADAAVLVDWFDAARARAVARQHSAVFGHHVAPRVGPSGDARFRGLAGVDEWGSPDIVEVPRDFLGALAVLDDESFRSIGSLAPGVFEDLWSEPSPDRIRAVVDHIVSVVSSAASGDPRSGIESSFVRVLGEVGAAAAGAGLTGRPEVGFATVLAAEGARALATRLPRRKIVRDVVEYWSDVQRTS